MIWFWVLFIAAAVVAFLLDRLPQFLGFAVLVLIAIKIAVGLLFLFVVAGLFTRARRCCCRC